MKYEDFWSNFKDLSEDLSKDFRLEILNRFMKR